MCSDTFDRGDKRMQKRARYEMERDTKGIQGMQGGWRDKKKREMERDEIGMQGSWRDETGMQR